MSSALTFVIVAVCAFILLIALENARNLPVELQMEDDDESDRSEIDLESDHDLLPRSDHETSNDSDFGRRVCKRSEKLKFMNAFRGRIFSDLKSGCNGMNFCS